MAMRRDGIPVISKGLVERIGILEIAERGLLHSRQSTFENTLQLSCQPKASLVDLSQSDAHIH